MATITSLDFNIRSNWDGSGIRAARTDLDLLYRDLERVSGMDVHINVTVDTAQARAQLDELQQLLGDREVHIGVHADTAAATAQLAEATHDREVNIHTDTSTLRNQLDQLRQQINGVTDRIDVLGKAADHNFGVVGTMAKWASLGILALGPAAALAGGAILASLPLAMGAAALIMLRKIGDVSDALDNLKKTAQKAVEPLAAGVAASVNQISTWLTTAGPMLTNFFKAAGTSLEGFTNGIIAVANNALPGMTTALQGMKPVSDGFTQGMADLGTGISGMFDGLSKGAFGFGMALQATFGQVGALLEILGSNFGKMANTGTVVLNGLLGGINSLVGGILNGMVPAMQAMSGPLSNLLQVLGEQLGGAFRTILPALGQLIAALSTALIPVLQALMPAVSQIVAAFAASLIPAVQALAPVLLLIAQGLAQILTWLRPIMPVLGPLIVGIWALNAALAANPIAIVVVAIAALVAAIVGLATKTQFFQTIWNTVWGAVKEAAATVWGWLKTAWEVTAGAFVTAWNTVSAALSTAWHAVWSAIQTAAQAVWTALQTAWNTVVNAFSTVWTAVSGALTTAWNTVWNALSAAAQAIWSALSTAWTNFINNLKALWDTFSSALTSAWQTFWNAIQTAAQAVWNALQAAWQAFTSAVTSIYDSFSSALQAAWQTFWNAVQAAAQAVWNAVQAAWTAFTNAVRAIYDAWSSALQAAWQAFWNAVQAFTQALWNAVQAAWTAFTNAVRAIYDAWSSALQAAWQAFWNAVQSIAQTVWNALQAAWQTFTDLVRSIYDTWASALQTAWSTLWNGIQTAAQSVWDVISGAWKTFTDGVRSVYDTFSSGITTAWSGLWNGIHDTAKTIWNTIIDVVGGAVNGVISIIGGIIGAWDTVVDHIGLSSLHVDAPGPININQYKLADGGPVGLASGGAVSGPGTSRSDSIPAMLSDGEFVMQASAVKQYGSHMMHSINAGRYADGGMVQHFVTGGPVTGASDPIPGSDVPGGQQGTGGLGTTNVPDATGTSSSLPAGAGTLSPLDAAKDVVAGAAKWVLGTIGAPVIKAMFSPFNAMIDAVGSKTGMIGKFLVAGTHRVEDGLINLLTQKDAEAATTSVAGGSYAAALAWAKTQVGFPYQWGGNGDPSWDCSGFMSAIESVIRGESPHRRWATGAFSGDTAPDGWTHNGKSPFMIGITNAGVGHTAGTLNGTNVECRGGDGCVIGAAARGYSDPMFTDIYAFTGVKPTAVGGVGKDFARNLLTSHGWGDDQWPHLDALWTRESNWDPTATNPSSGAYGIPQALPPEKMGAAGADWKTNPNTQIVWGENYIADTYGSPAAADAFQASHNGYDSGGWLMPGNTVAYNGTGQPEAVLTSSQWGSVSTLVEKVKAAATSATSHIDGQQLGEQIKEAVLQLIHELEPGGTNFTINGATDPKAVADQVAKKLAEVKSMRDQGVGRRSH